MDIVDSDVNKWYNKKIKQGDKFKGDKFKGDHKSQGGGLFKWAELKR
ncbi:MAG: hypothetical protein J6A07_05090 [Firmicutes bacterium]|nr:hypothetical protein [Bacillota bacterium]